MIQKFFLLVLLAACVISVLTINVDEYKDIEYTVFDYDLYEDVLDHELCLEQLEDMRTFEFYDASFRLPQGILGGHTTSMGNFHQCLGIKQEAASGPIEGKYAMVVIYGAEFVSFPILAGKSWLNDTTWLKINTESTMKQLNSHRRDMLVAERFGPYDKRIGGLPIFDLPEFSLAMCIPKTCSVEDALARILENPIIDLQYYVEFYRLPDDKPMAAADYTAIAIFSAIGILTILSTAYDIWQRFLLKKDPVESSAVLRCCSLYTNTKVLMNFKSIPGTIDCIDGIRSLSIMWIIIAHSVITTYLSKYTLNIIEVLDWGELRRNTWLPASELSVDTFFALSGLLLVYTSAKKMSQMQLLKNLHVFYLNRLLRMFPLLACAVLLQASLFHHVTDGVDWPYMGYFVQMCREYWWTALLHIQNLVNPVDHCIPQTWYLSVDVQLHMLSPLILFWVLGSRRSAWSGLAVGGTAFLTASTVYIFLKDFSNGYNFDIYYYKNTLTRCPPFLIGMIFGYILHVFREKKLKMSIWLVCLGYLIASGVSFYCVYTFYRRWESELAIDFNRAFVRGAWSMCVCWIIFACAHGYGGPINWFLSLKIWKFMARISYAMYLFHYSIIFAVTSSKVIPRYFSVGNIFLEFASVMVYTVITSVAACVLIDAPCMTLQKMLVKDSTIDLQRLGYNQYDKNMYIRLQSLVIVLTPSSKSSGKNAETPQENGVKDT